MKKFNSKAYFDFIKDPEIISNQPFYFAQPKSSGIKLISQYLQEKYSANICHPISGFSNDGYPSYINFKYFSDISDIKPYIRIAQNQQGDYRQAFVIGGTGHVKFMVFIREGDKEAILYSDSLDTNHKFVEKIHSDTGVKVFANYNLSKRQADNSSCYLDALVLGRDTTARDKKTGKYQIEGLIDLLEKRLQKTVDGVSYVLLPNQLLKTAQISNFVELHKDGEAASIGGQILPFASTNSLKKAKGKI